MASIYVLYDLHGMLSLMLYMWVQIGSIMRMKRMSEDMRQVLLHRKIQEAANWQQRCGVLQRKLRYCCAARASCA